MRLLFEVEDTGTGIAPEELTLLFNAFAQTPGGRTAMEGTGLGLAIYHSFAQLLGSEIDVKSTLEQGSIFKYSILATFADQT